MSGDTTKKRSKVLIEPRPSNTNLVGMTDVEMCCEKAVFLKLRGKASEGQSEPGGWVRREREEPV